MLLIHQYRLICCKKFCNRTVLSCRTQVVWLLFQDIVCPYYNNSLQDQVLYYLRLSFDTFICLVHIARLTIWNHLFSEFCLVDTWVFAHWRFQRAVTRLENVRQLDIRRDKKLSFQLSDTQHPYIFL